MLGQVVTGVLTQVVMSAGRRVGGTVSELRGSRDPDHVAIAQWFDTYRLASRDVELAQCAPGQAEELREHLTDDEVQAALHELLAARLSDAPELDIARVRTSFRLSLQASTSVGEDLADELFDFFDGEVCALVGKIEGGDPALLTCIRSEALLSRMIAVMRAVERHTAALESRLDPQAEADYLTGYRRHLLERHGRIEPPDFERRRKIPIEDLYVAPAIVAFGVPEADAPSTRIDLWKFDAGLDRTVLLGDPGGGKTTAAQVLIHHHARDPRGTVPFLVVLREFAADEGPGESVVSHIEHKLDAFYQHPAPQGLVARLLLSGRATVIFDGLDELLDTSRRAEMSEIVERFATEYPQARILVTSRVIGYDQARLDARQFACFRIDRFEEDQVREYVHNWFAQEEGATAQEADRSASAFMDDSATVADLRSNPLMLALLCILHRGEGSLPRNRGEVYERCATLLMRKWDERRRILATFRASQWLEAALQYLAYWTLTRPDGGSAVTERALIAETCDFLHGTAFESEPAAYEAAVEFVELCRGRWWVFTDTGTTALGEPLYSFTHRTFLEYFAAAHLAYAADSPEDLARDLRPRISRQEWAMVCELAVQIKDRTSRDGARRIHAALLDDLDDAPPDERSAALQFLARTLKSVDPTPDAIRRLTYRILDHLFNGDVREEFFNLPLVWLLASCDTCCELVDDEITKRVELLIATDDVDSTVLAIELAVLIGDVLEWPFDAGPQTSSSSDLFDFWRSCADRNVEKYRDIISSAAIHGGGPLHVALSYEILRVADVLAFPRGLTMLFNVTRSQVFNIGWANRIEIFLRTLADGRGGAFYREGRDALHDIMEAFSDIGYFLVDHPEPPWVLRVEDIFELSDFTPHTKYRHYDAMTFLGAAMCTMTAFERRYIADFGAHSKLAPYFKSRMAGSKDAELPPLPIPEAFQDLFIRWAHGDVDFVGERDETTA